MQWEHEVFTAAHIHANPASEHPAFTIPGVTELNVMHDMLHVADVNGVSAHFCGTALFTFVFLTQMVLTEKMLWVVYGNVSKNFMLNLVSGKGSQL